MVDHSSNEGGSHVPTTDIESNSVSHSHDEPERATLIEDSEPIFDDSATRDIDNRARFSIVNSNDGEDSYEAEEDMAHTLTEITRQRKKQQKKAALRMLVVAAFLFALVAISLGVFFAVRAKQLNAYSSSNTNSGSQTTSAPTHLPFSPLVLSPPSKTPATILSRPSISYGITPNHNESISTDKPLPYTPPVPSPTSKAPAAIIGPSISPGIAPYHNTSTTTGLPQNITVETPEAPYANLEYFCSTDAQNQDLTKCEAECSKGRCCWATNTCTDNTLCTAYSPCSILTLSATNDTNSYVGGCAAEVSDMYPSSFECYPIFLPCNTDMDCEGQMLNLGVFVSCTSECSESQYPTPSDIKNEMNISDMISQIGNAIDVIKNLTYYSDDNVPVKDDTEWNRITFDDFESGWGNFRDGGEDSKLITLYDGEMSNHVARIRHNEKESILPLKEPKNVTQYRALRVNVWVAGDGLEPGDMLLLEYSPDGGSNWEIVKQWIFGKDLLENGSPYNFNVTFYSTDYVFSSYALIRFRSDANSKSDNFYIDEVEFDGSRKIDSIGTDVMAVNFFSYCGARNETNDGMFTCNPARISCNSDQDCYENVASSFITATENCGDDPDCIKKAQNTVEYVHCLTECDQSTIAVSQKWEIITSDDFENGYGNFEDEGGDSKIVTFVDDKNVTSKMVQLRNNNGADSSLPLHKYYNVSKYVALRVSLLLVFQGIESGDTLLLEYSPEPASWLIVEEWVFGGEVLTKNSVPYTQEAIFYNSAYTNFTEKARIRFRSLGNSDNDHFLIDNVVFSGLTK